MLEAWTSLLRKVPVASVFAPTVLETLSGSLAQVLRHTKFSAVRTASGKLITQLLDVIQVERNTGEGAAELTASACEHLRVLALECKQHNALQPLAARITQVVDEQ
jgi:hypothetical protein